MYWLVQEKWQSQNETEARHSASLSSLRRFYDDKYCINDHLLHMEILVILLFLGFQQRAKEEL